MGRKRSHKREKAYIFWFTEREFIKKNKVKLKDIARLFDVSPEQIRKWKCQDKWDMPALPKSDANNRYMERQSELPATFDSWIEIEIEYITSIGRKPCKLKDLSIKYGIPYHTRP